MFKLFLESLCDVSCDFFVRKFQKPGKQRLRGVSVFVRPALASNASKASSFWASSRRSVC
jgi:hypothetical protein